MHGVGGSVFRDAMARFPTGVTIVTADDEHGRPYGFTASSFCSVSLDPPLVLVCIARSAHSYPVFAGNRQFAISVLRADQSELALRFARKSADKFGGGEFVRTPSGSMVLKDPVMALECVTTDQHQAGDHMIMVGRVQSLSLAGSGAPAVYCDRAFSTVSRAG